MSIAKKLSSQLRKIFLTPPIEITEESKKTASRLNAGQSIHFVSATRLSEEEFWEKSYLGVSLKPLLLEGLISISVKFRNTAGLGSIYNEEILKSRNDIIVFLHDDVFIENKEVFSAIRAAVYFFDVFGVAGNTRISKNQPGWSFREIKYDHFLKDYGHLSGALKHGKPDQNTLEEYGPAPMPCQLLDGVFIAAKRERLAKAKVFFDPIFNFHFYDLDFCRTAKKRKLTIGTWPLEIIHRSPGEFGSESWREAYSIYLEKWQK